MKKREIIEGVIKDYDFPNKGSFELDGKKVIVKGALPGQKVSCMVSKVRKDKAEARRRCSTTMSTVWHLRRLCIPDHEL